jgi:hypothetical protein
VVAGVRPKVVLETELELHLRIVGEPSDEVIRAVKCEQIELGFVVLRLRVRGLG